MNDYAIHKAIEAKGIDLSECRFSFSRVNSPTGIPDTEAEFNNIDWHDHDISPVTWAEVKTKGDELDAEFIANEYQRDRKVEYDALNQFEMQFDDELNDTTTWKDAIEAIKAKYPKPE